MEHSPISAGIENSNTVTTSQGEYVLALFEHHAPDEVRNFVRLARHLGEKDLCVESGGCAGVWLHSLKNKPAILCRRFTGSHPDQLSGNNARLSVANWRSFIWPPVIC